MRKKVLLSSILTIALCFSLIAGSTFALFTSSDEVNIAVTAGKVEMVAGVAITKVESVLPNGSGTITDEFGGKYAYGYMDDIAPYEFKNTGTAEITGNTLTLNKITPGDKVTFAVSGTNGSDVTIQYRYIIECVGDYKLMSGLVLTADGNSYESVASYTSAWTTLVEGQNTGDIVLSLELPVDAKDEYETKSTDIKITVEAVQGNAATSGGATVEYLALSAEDVKDTIANGGNVLLGTDVNENLVIGSGTSVSMDLNGQTVNGSILSNGTVAISGGKIDVDAYGFQNVGGDATLSDVDMNAGSTQDYGLISEGGSVTIDDATIVSGGGGIGAVDGAEVVFESGSLDVNSASTSGRYHFYAVGQGTTVTVNDGEFAFSKTLNQKRAYVYAANGATVYINGGTFGAASTRSGYTAGIIVATGGTVIITGGTFGFDPSNWVADGYVATYDSTTATWTVTAE